LPEDTACTEEGEEDPNNRGHQALVWLGCLLRDVLHDLDCALVEKIAHLLRDLVPRTARIVAKDQADYREQHEHQRRQREDRVVSESSA
jgi:hypothetical protein